MCAHPARFLKRPTGSRHSGCVARASQPAMLVAAMKKANPRLVPLAPAPSSRAVTALMRGNRGRDTGPERRLRSALFRLGQRGYRLNSRHLPGKPDIVFPTRRVAVFVHGCFWHRCPRCSLPIPSSNSSYWCAKLNRNVARDEQNRRVLESQGWRVVEVWECEIKVGAAVVARLVEATVRHGQRGRRSGVPTGHIGDLGRHDPRRLSARA